MTKSKKSALKIATELLTKISQAARLDKITMSEVVYMNHVAVSLINNRAAGDSHSSDRVFAKKHIHTLSERNGLYSFTDDDGKEKVGYILRDSEDNCAYKEVYVNERYSSNSTYTVHNCCLTKLEK